MQSGLQNRLERLFNRRGDGRAVCVAADHGYMSDVTDNVVQLRPITEAVIRGGADGILMSPGQAMRLASLFQGRDGPALIVRADWMNMPRLGGANLTNAVPQRRLVHQKVLSAEQALSLGASAITIYLFVGYNDEVEAKGIESCAKFASECRKVGLPCIMEPLAVGGQVTGANQVDLLTLGARMCVELGADALKIPYTGDVESFRHLIEVSQVPVLVLGGARSPADRDALELFGEGLEAGCSGCLMGRNVTKAPDPEKLMRQMVQMAHAGYTVDEALRGERWDKLRLRVVSNKCTGCQLCVTACVGAHDEGQFGAHLARLSIQTQGLGQHKVMYCTLCKKCIEVCPTAALKWHSSTGAVQLIPENCTSCGKCVDICPTHVILQGDQGITFANTALPLAPAGAQSSNDGGTGGSGWLPVVCDLCGGDPACATICPTGAITTDERKRIL